MIKKIKQKYALKKALFLTLEGDKRITDLVEKQEDKDEKLFIYLKDSSPPISTQTQKQFTVIFEEILGSKPPQTLFISPISHKKQTPSAPAKNKLDFAKKIIAVSSCKGGVGKSTVSFLLAKRLSKAGYSVGLLDADIYGPSIPILTNLTEYEPLVSPDKKLIPGIFEKVLVASVGFVVKDSSALIWRGPMLTKALNSLLLNCQWGELDYLIIDLPPGTGDTYITLFQNYHTDGVCLVTTPSELAVLELQKTIDMIKIMNVNILGLIENMSHDDNDIQKRPFGEIDLEDFSAKNELDYLGKMPIASLENLEKHFENIKIINL